MRFVFFKEKVIIRENKHKNVLVTLSKFLTSSSLFNSKISGVLKKKEHFT